DGPVFGAAVRACKQRIFSVERDRTYGAFDRVVVEINATIIDEARQALPARQRIADGVCELALLADQGELCAQPLLECIGERPAVLLADEAALLGTPATDVLLDSVELSDVFERLARNGRRARSCEFVEVAPHMRPAERKRDVPALGELGVAGIAIDLQDPLEAIEMGDRPFRLAVGCIDISNARRIGAAPWPIVRGIGPELPGLGAAAAGIEHRHRRLIGKQLEPLPEFDEKTVVQWTQMPGGMADPVRQRGPIQIDALTGVNLGLPV